MLSHENLKLGTYFLQSNDYVYDCISTTNEIIRSIFVKQTNPVTMKNVSSLKQSSV